MQINCNFNHYSNIPDYYCKIQHSKIPKNVENVKFVGDHKDGKSNASVTDLYFHDCDMQKIPENLTKIFPNLTGLSIYNSDDLHEIKKEDLKGLEKLKQFRIQNCNLEFLPGNLLEDMKDLEVISFNNNQIKFIGENLLDGLVKLKFVSFLGNKNINLRFNSHDPENSTTLEDIKREIREKCAPDYPLEVCERSASKWKNLVKDLLKRNAELEEKLTILDKNKNELEENLKNSEEKLKKSKETLIKKDEELNEMKMLNELMQQRESDVKKSKETVDDIKKFTNIEEFKNFKVKVEQKEFKLHKFILAARSQTFAELFTENPAAEELNLVDVTVEAFKIFIDFVYNNQLPQNEVNLLELFMLGSRLKVEKLKEFAAAKLMTEINPENAFEILKSANKHQHEELIKKSFEEVKKMFPTIKFEDKLAKLPEMIEILIRASLRNEERLEAARMEEDEESLSSAKLEEEWLGNSSIN